MSTQPINVQSTAVAGNQTFSPEGKRTILAAHMAFFVDMFDIYLPIIALGPAMSYFMPKNLSVSVSTTIFYVAFAATLVGRPVGAMIFGHFGDKLGRKQSALVSIMGFAIVTLLMAFLPGYEHIGLWAIGLLITLRFVDGLPGRRIYRRQSLGHGIFTERKKRSGRSVCDWRLSTCVRHGVYYHHNHAAPCTSR